MNSNKKTPPAKSARFDFNAAAEKIVREHPELEANTVFVDLDTDKRRGALRPRMKATLSSEFRQKVKEAEIRARHRRKGSAFALKGRSGLNAVIMTLGREFGFVHGSAEDRQMDGHFAFHHEVGHIVVPGAAKRNAGAYFARLFGDAPSEAEGAADAYAVIRHLQEYGAGSTGIERVPLRRAMDAIHHDTPEYFTTFIVDKVLEQRERLAQTTPAQAVTTAAEYMARYTPTRAEVERLRTELAPLRGKLYKASKDNVEPFRKLAEITLDPRSSPLTFYLGNRVLGAYLGKLLNGPEWVDVAKRLREREKTMTLDTIFPPKPAAPPQNAPKAA